MPTPPDDDDDDFELELEAVDPDILAMEQERGRRKTEEAVARVDIDEILDKQRDRQGDYDIDWSRFRTFRFTTRHLLILTAILAIGLTLTVQMGGCMALFVMALMAIGAGWYVVALAERREATERKRIREEFYASEGAKPAASAAVADSEGFDAIAVPPPRREFRFAFSMREMFITMTIAAVALAVLFALGPKAVTIALGVIALAGLAVQTFGWFDPPPAVVLGWWLLLMLYLLLGLLTAFGLEVFGP